MSRRTRPWVKLMARFWEDDKLIKAGPTAELLYLRILAWCAEAGSDGRITTAQIQRIDRSLTRQRQARDRLVTCGLLDLEQDSDTYVIKAWFKYNQPADVIDAAHERDAARKRRSRKQGSRSGVRPDARTVSARSPNVEVEVEVPSVPLKGTERTELADAPRCADGATRPLKIENPAVVVVGSEAAENPDQADPQLINREQALAEARQSIAEGRRNNPAAGRQFRFNRRTVDSKPTSLADVLNELNERNGHHFDTPNETNGESE